MGDESPAAPATMSGEKDANGEVLGGELMPFDDGSLTADKAQCNAANLVINFAEPDIAAGTAVFGLNLLVLPLLARLSLKTDGSSQGIDDPSSIYSYSLHGETNPKQAMRLFTEGELKTRFGLLDSAFLFQELTMTTDEVDEHMNSEGLDVTEEETTRIQKWRDKANGHLKSLQKRSALAFLGLPPDAGEAEVNKMYKKMALELHPDKGGDPEKFQELQEMKERLNEIEKEDGDDDEDPEDEEAKKAKEKEKMEEDAENQKLPPDERMQKMRMDVHDNAVRVWQRAKKATEEIVGDKSIKANPQPALNILRAFVDRFATLELKSLKHDDVRGAEAKFRKFLKQGAEILAVAAIADVQATLTTLAMNFNFKLAARSGSKEIKLLCDRLMEAVAEIPSQVESFLKSLEHTIDDQKDRDRRKKEERAAQQRAKEQAGDFSGDAGPKAKQEGGAAAGKGGPSQQAVPKAAPKAKMPSAAGDDPFADFAWDDEKGPKNSGGSKVSASHAAATPSVTTLRKGPDDSEPSAMAAASQEKRTCWDPDFDHAYAGALKSNGSGIFCRPCQRWITTYNFDTEAFLTHVQRVHPKPPAGWKN